MGYGKRKIPFYSILFGVIGAILFLVGMIFTLYGNKALVNYNLKNRDSLVNGTSRFELWMKSPDYFLNVYFFNLTNPNEVVKGETPIVEEIGPYVYDYTIEKVDISFPEEDIIEYRQKFMCVFNIYQSLPLDESDIITTVDFALLASILTAAEFASDQMTRVKMAIEKIFPGRESPFITNSVANLLFDGIQMDCSDRQHMIYLLCRQLTIQAPMFFWKDESRAIKFALLHEKNITKPSLYRAYQGTKDLSLRGAIQKYNGKTSVDTWYSLYCNMLNGSSTGELYPTHITEKSRLYYFEDFLGRSLYADFVNSSKIFDLDVLRFEVTEALFGSATLFPDNECFCPRGMAETEDQSDPLFCTPHGIFNLAPYSKAPILVSQPYFIFADHNPLQDLIFTPARGSKKDLLTFVEIEPVTGAPIVAKKGLQFNLELRPIKDFAYLENIQPRIMPALRVEQTFELEANLFFALSEEVSRYHRSFILSWCFIGLGIIGLIVATIILAHHHKLFRRNESKVRSKETTLDPDLIAENEKNLSVSSSSTIAMSPNKVCHQQNYM